jgi:hypothetical protein
MEKNKHTRNSLYFDKYQFCVKLHMIEATALREWSHDGIDRIINQRKRYSLNINWGGSWKNSSAERITPEVQQRLHRICDIINSSRDQAKVMLTGNWIYVYTSDQTLLKTLMDASTSLSDTCTEVVLQGPPDCVILQKANHQYRSYFRNLRLDNNTSLNLRGFLQVQENIRLSPALMTFFENGWQMSQDYYFIDHDNMSTISMLSMIAPRLVRKTLPITQYK